MVFSVNLGSERIKNILRSVQIIALLLFAYFLGMNASIWTNQQIKDYCLDYNNFTCAKECFGYGVDINYTLPINLTGL